MTCREFVSFLMEYLDGTLPPTEREAFEEHLRLCPGCVDYMASYRRTVSLTKDAFVGRDPAAPMDGIPEELVQAILAARGKR